MTQSTRNATVAVTTTSVQAAYEQFNPTRRTQFIITNLSASATVYIVKGYGEASSSNGIVLGPNGIYIESTDSGFQCWQGPVSAISTGSHNISVVETLENGVK